MMMALKVWFTSKKMMSLGFLLVALLLGVWLFAFQNQPAVAQQPQDGQITYASVEGNSTIVSHKMTLATADFAAGGARENVVVSPAGLTLAPGVGQGVYLTDVMRSPLGYTTDIGPVWLADIPEGADVSVEVRLSHDGQVWNDWSAVPVEYYPTRSGEYGGVLVWANAATLYTQFKFTLAANSAGAAPVVQHLALFFNDTSQGPSDEMALAQAQVEIAGDVALTCPAKPLVIPRTAWGCPPSQDSPRWPPAYQPVTHIVVNHTATPNSADDWAKVVRSIWHYHANILGWGDVGYQYLVDPLGNIYEGRAGGDDVIGAFDGFNRGAMGIGYIGCYGNCNYLGISNAEPSAEMLEAGNELIAWKVGQKELDPLGMGEYCYQTLSNIVSRSDITCRGGSLSPGDFLDAKLPDIRSEVVEKVEACQAVTPTPGVTVIITIEPETPTPTATAITPTVTVTPTATSTPTATVETPTPTLTPTPTITPTSEVTPTPTSTPIGPRVEMSPVSLSLEPDEAKTAAIEVVNIEDLYGVELYLEYDPAVVEVVDADSTREGVQVKLGDVFDTPPIFMVENQVVDGVIHFVAARQAPAQPFNGSGSLIEITWRGKAQGESAVTFKSLKLSDPDGHSLTAFSQEGQILVGQQPGTLVRGRIILEGKDDAAGVVVINGQTQVETGPDGTFELTLASASDYAINMTKPGYLSARFDGEVAASSNVIELGNITLPGGDVTGDDQINILDLALIGGRYGTEGTVGDVNEDGVVNILDLTLSASNYGQSGPVMIGLEIE